MGSPRGQTCHQQGSTQSARGEGPPASARKNAAFAAARAARESATATLGKEGPESATAFFASLIDCCMFVERGGGCDGRGRTGGGPFGLGLEPRMGRFFWTFCAACWMACKDDVSSGSFGVGSSSS